MPILESKKANSCLIIISTYDKHKTMITSVYSFSYWVNNRSGYWLTGIPFRKNI